MGGKMKTLLFALLMVLFLSVRLVSAEDAPGKTIFLANKCNTCHSIASDKIEKTSKTKPKKEPPDLSTVGDQRTAEWIEKYIKKTETIDNVKHVKGWTGKPEDLTTLAKWLADHKKAAS
jgi:cbb3-type cytochrome oxidase cytochrome c subunit